MPKRILEETKQRAIRLVLDHLDECPNLTTACETVARRLGFGAESLRRWVRRAQVDAGDRHCQSTSKSERAVSCARRTRSCTMQRFPSRGGGRQQGVQVAARTYRA